MFLTFLLAALPPLSGTWITDAEMARQTPRPYEARQFQTKKLPPVNKSLQNRHILFRKAFELDEVKAATLRITADDYYKLYVKVLRFIILHGNACITLHSLVNDKL